MVAFRPRYRNNGIIYNLQRLLQKRIHISRYSIPFYIILILNIPIIAFIIFLIVKAIIDHHNNDFYLTRSREKYQSKVDQPFYEGCVEPQINAPRANATLVVLARNNEIEDVLKSMKSLERHFNQWYQYPWTFLNDEVFDEEFKRRVIQFTSAPVHFGTISSDIWDFPEDLDPITRKENIQLQGDRGIMYGAMESYHKMCRFYSGGFYKHDLVRKYEWYWRVEPNIEFFCDIPYDPFIEMGKQGKKYGFTVIIKELFETVPNLFRYTKAFLKENNIKPRSAWNLFVDSYKRDLIIKDESFYSKYFKFVSDESSIKSRFGEIFRVEHLISKFSNKDYKLNQHDEKAIEDIVLNSIDRARLPTLQGESMDGESYNLLHFWSNFEIARVDLWDNNLYESYFKFLEDNGGFFKERWGDAPIHSIAVAFLLNIEEIHYFRDIGYKHSTIGHCPANSPHQLPFPEKTKTYKIKDSVFDNHYDKFDKPHSYGSGCRCRCPDKHKEIEDHKDDFYGNWFDMINDVQYFKLDFDEYGKELKKAFDHNKEALNL
ncbi:hypothetical protein WICMUC_005194 [Wickerhamomyces mucosus]|uniref:Mannosyltransferase n=1 Tax=Wickerhamomyces mucosus TaxID=1378264 RepID=A0A9P8PAA0_9ASCO|nr:hypothetical protein WICMUC_005194 [Wickerhamomyces mucosus]